MMRPGNGPPRRSSGNAFVYKPERNRWQRLRPDWVDVMYRGGVLIGYRYRPGGNGKPFPIEVQEMAHWMPYPDPENPGLGMSWLTPVSREILGDSGMATHKNRFFRQGATPNMVIQVQGRLSPDRRKDLEDAISRKYEGVQNAYRTMVIDGDAEVKTVGTDFRQMDFAQVQGAGEIRIAAAGGVPPVLIGLSKGLESATYSNYLHAMRRFADSTLRPLWGSATEALEVLVPQRDGFTFTYDDRRVPALQQDAKDDAEIQGLKARTMMTLIQAGYEPMDVAKAVWNNDLENLEHTGNIPTTLYPEGQPSDSEEAANANQ
jgi:HK97 family phage portal protein